MLTRPLTQPLTGPLVRGVGEGGVLSAFKPSSLYVGGYKGFALDLSDKTTLYQDSARTTLVSAAGDPIGSPSDISGNGAHPTQATTASKPLWQGYGDFDGVDDGWATPSIDLTAARQVTVVIGLRKQSDSAIQSVVESSSLAGVSNPGSFVLFAPLAAGGSDVTFRAAGTTQQVAAGSAASPALLVLSGVADIAGATISLRKNGALAQSTSSSLGTGNFGNYTIYIGRRGGSSLPFNGRIYRAIVIGRTLSASELAQAERWCATPTGVTLP